MNATPPHEFEEAAKQRTPVKIGRAIFLLVLVAAAAAAWGISSRRTDETKLTRWTLDRAIPTVSVVSPEHGGGTRELVLPGDVDAFYNAVVHAQVSGYVHAWYKDIGAHVKAGECSPRSTRRNSTSASPKLANSSPRRKPIKPWRRSPPAAGNRCANPAQSRSNCRQEGCRQGGQGRRGRRSERELDRLKALKAFANIVAPFDGWLRSATSISVRWSATARTPTRAFSPSPTRTRCAFT